MSSVVVCQCGARRELAPSAPFPAHVDVRQWPRFAWCPYGDTSRTLVGIPSR